MRVALGLVCALATTGAQAFPVERCMNLSNFLEVERGASWSYDYRVEHLSQISEAGFDTLRLPVRAGDWWAHGRLDPRFRRLVFDTVENARDAGLTVILDLHHYDRFIADPEFYGGQFVAIWIALAEMFAPDDGLIFELLNEPTDETTIAATLPHYTRAITSIRKRHPDAWIIFGGADWNSLDQMLALPQPDDDRIIHTFHYYTPFNFTHQQLDWTDEWFPESFWGTADERAALTADMARAVDHHTPVFLGEFGTAQTAPRESRLAWLHAVRTEAEANGIPWCHWGFGAGFGLFDTEGNGWDADALNTVIRP